MFLLVLRILLSTQTSNARIAHLVTSNVITGRNKKPMVVAPVSGRERDASSPSPPAVAAPARLSSKE